MHLKKCANNFSLGKPGFRKCIFKFTNILQTQYGEERSTVVRGNKRNSTHTHTHTHIPQAMEPNSNQHFTSYCEALTHTEPLQPSTKTEL